MQIYQQMIGFVNSRLTWSLDSIILIINHHTITLIFITDNYVIILIISNHHHHHHHHHHDSLSYNHNQSLNHNCHGSKHPIAGCLSRSNAAPGVGIHGILLLSFTFGKYQGTVCLKCEVSEWKKWRKDGGHSLESFEKQEIRTAWLKIM